MRRDFAPAKVNLCLYVGRAREDGYHPLVSVVQPLALGDDVTMTDHEGPADEVVCPGVSGHNLAARAASAFRALVPDLPPLRIMIDKRIPVAAGLGGGSADAAAVLRAANRLTGAGLQAGRLRRLALSLGSDVPSQVEPRHSIVSGVGEQVEPAGVPPMSLVLVPQPAGLSTAVVYAELDRLRAAGSRPVDDAFDPEPLRRLAGARLHELAAGLENELQPATMSLRPELAQPLAALTSAGALAAQVAGSGPTTFGVFADRAAASAAASLIDGAILTETRTC